MIQSLIILSIYIVFLTFLIKVFKEHLIKIKDIFAFTLIFWCFYIILRNEQLMSEIAKYFGFQLASNLMFTGISVVLTVYLIKLHLRVVILERKLRSFVFRDELEKIKKILWSRFYEQTMRLQLFTKQFYIVFW